jgi:hypothetical protein
MKKLLTLLIACATLGGSLTAQVTSVYHTVYGVDEAGPGLTTYRIFADLQDADDFLSSVYAASNDYLVLGGSGGTLNNDGAGTVTGDALGTGFCMFVPTVCYDSFVTIGWFGNTAHDGSTIACGQATTTIASEPSASVIGDSFGTTLVAPNLVMEDGAWFTTNLTGCNDNGFGIGPNNSVFIAQVTIPSTDDLVYNLNIQLFNAAIGNDAIFTVGDCMTVNDGEVDGSSLGLHYPFEECEPANDGCMDSTACNYDSAANNDDGSCEFESCYGCMETTACNYDSEATMDDGSCDFGACEGCMDSTACNYDEFALSDDGSCEYVSCAGCTDSLACNFDSTATMDDASCEFDSCAGCTDEGACNFDSTATIDNDSCDYSCLGCTNMDACNYDSAATIDDDSCEFDSCTGCTDMDACNYDSTATIDNDTCDYSCLGCTDMGACNYDSTATMDDDSCDYSCLGCTDMDACNYDSTATMDDASCEYDSCAGCTDSLACNFDSTATMDDDSCEFQSCAGCTDMEACNYDSTATIDDSSCDFDSCAGCTDMEACNYDSTATIDDDSCEYDSCAGCTDVEACNYDSTATIDDDSCDFDSCAGCTDSTALNYDSTATIDDGSCFFDCEFPTFEYEVYCDETDQDNFYVELTVSGTSNGFPFTVSNDVNASEENITGAGVYDLGAFANNANVTFTVASDDIDCSATSDVLTDNCIIDSVEEIDLAAMAIFPNPTNGDFTITNVWNDEQMTIEVLNALGQKVFTQRASANGNGDFTVSALDQLAEGNYMVRVSQGNEIQVMRIIVQK